MSRTESETPTFAADESAGTLPTRVLLNRLRRAARSGGRRAAGAIWNVVIGALQGVLVRFADHQLPLPLKSRAEDVVAEAWLRIQRSWRKFRYRGPGPVLGWARLVVKRVIWDLQRRDGVRPEEGHLGDGDGLIPSAGLDPADAGQREEVIRTVRAAVDRLPDAERKAVVAIDLEGRTAAEVARRTGKLANSITVARRRGRYRLRTLLSTSRCEIA